MTEPPDRLIAALADRYRIERELGRGGMATVYLAEDLKHKRKVALKVLKPELAAVLGGDRFVQEITTTANLQHPHILPLFDSGTADGFLFYVMPFIDGESLRGKLDRETQLGVDEAVKIASEIADALHYAHEHGVIHRDVKPENILLANGRPMVADFGIALALSAAAGGRMTETGMSLGTPHYMAPEQATAEKEITARADVYSLASVLYEMLTGNPPHTGASAQQIIMKIVTEVAAPVTTLRKAVPPNVAAALAKALEKLPADRFQSGKEFADALGNPAFAGPPGVGSGAAPARTGPGRPAVLHGIVTVALAVALGWVLLGRGSPTPGARAAWVTDLGVPDSAAFSDGLTFSPDGSLLLYGGIEPNQIWLRRAGSGTPTAIAGTAGGCCPALSPDGARVAFLRGNDLHVIPLGGGPSTLIGSGFLQGDDVAWTGDGQLVAVGVAGDLLRVAESGGPVTQFTSPDTTAGEGQHWSPRALPDGRGVVFSIVPLSADDTAGTRIGVVGPEGGAHRVLLPGRVAAYADPGHLLVLRDDGTIVAVPFDLASLRITGPPVLVLSGLGATGFTTWLGYLTAARHGPMAYVGGHERTADIAWVGRTGLVASLDSNSRIRYRRIGPRVSQDGRIMAFEAVTDDKAGIDVRDRQTGATSRIEVGSGSVDRPSLSADGRWLVFRVMAPEGRGIYRAEVGRLGQRTQILPDDRATNPTLSTDGRTLYFVREGAQGTAFIARAVEGPDSTERVLVTSFTASSPPRVSPDGRWLAYVATVGGTDQVFVRSTEISRTERWQVSRDGVAAASALAWSRDGRELYFIARDSLVAAPITGGEVLTVGRVETLFSVERYSRDFDVTSDGQFVLLRWGTAGFRLMLVDDWRKLMGTR